MTAILRQTLTGSRLSIAFVGFALFAISLLIAVTYEALGLEVLQQFEAMIPENFRAIMKAQGGFATDATGYLALDYRHPIYLVALLAFVIAAGSGAIAREIERGTILLLLSRPIPRWRFLLAKAAAMIFGIVTLLALALLGTWIGAVAIGIIGEVEMLAFLRISLLALALGLAVGGITFLASSLSNDGGQTIAIATAITVGMYFLDFLAALWSVAEPFGVLSIFHYYDPLGIVRADAFPWRDFAVLTAVALATFVAALVVFQRRDIAR